MCRVRMRGSVRIEVYPSLDCDDVRQIEVMDLEEDDELEIDVVEVNHGVLFTFADGRTSSLPVEAFELLQPCYCCEEDWHLATAE